MLILFILGLFYIYVYVLYCKAALERPSLFYNGSYKINLI